MTGELAPDQWARVVALLGPTGSGKTGAALQWATQRGAAEPAVEIISCDSVQVYRGLDVGSAKPSSEERRLVPHHLLDVVAPDEPFDAAAWARAATAAIKDVLARGRVPLIVGGTGLYYRALTEGLFSAPPPDAAIRARHRAEAAAAGVAALHARLAGVDPEAAARIHDTDLVRVSRALEVYEQTGTPISVLWRESRSPSGPRPTCVLLDPPLEQLRPRIRERLASMVEGGFVEEVRNLRAAGYGQARALQSLGYREIGQALDGVRPLDDALSAVESATVAYARRQRTWFRALRGAASTVSVSDPTQAGLALSTAAAGPSRSP